MEDSAPLSSSYSPSRTPPAISSKAKKLQQTASHSTLSSPGSLQNKEEHCKASLKSSSHFLDLLEQLKTYPSPTNQALSPSPSPENPRIEAIKRGEELLLKEGWPSAEDLDQVAHILGEHFE